MVLKQDKIGPTIGKAEWGTKPAVQASLKQVEREASTERAVEQAGINEGVIRQYLREHEAKVENLYHECGVSDKH
jgi:hypothetical protein